MLEISSRNSAALYTERVLKESSKREMWTAASLSDGKANRAHYGFGWFVESRGGHRVVGHDGPWQGFSAQISRYLDDRITVVILVNQGNCDPHLIADEVAAITWRSRIDSEVLVEGPEVEQPHHHHTGRSWLDVILGVSAVVISFISLFLAIHNGNAMERLVEANSWPSVQVTFSTLNQDSTPHIHFDIANKGVGPARIESLEATYNGSPLGDGRAVLNAMLGRTTVPPRPRIQTSTMTHAVMAAKETITFIDFKPEEYSAEDYDAMRLGVPKVIFRTCYCSVFDECWIADTAKPRPAKVKECPVAASAF